MEYSEVWLYETALRKVDRRRRVTRAQLVGRLRAGYDYTDPTTAELRRKYDALADRRLEIARRLCGARQEAQQEWRRYLADHPIPE
jgi:hypothetical protein